MGTGDRERKRDRAPFFPAKKEEMIRYEGRKSAQSKLHIWPLMPHWVQRKGEGGLAAIEGDARLLSAVRTCSSKEGRKRKTEGK